jgi:hypothetical protein
LFVLQRVANERNCGVDEVGVSCVEQRLMAKTENLISTRPRVPCHARNLPPGGWP